MARVYKNHIHLYSGLQEFQEKAVRMLNEIYGRQKPLDFIDFAVDKTEQMYVATGWYEGEDAPIEQKVGEPLSAAAQEAIAEPATEPEAVVEQVAVEQSAPEQDKAKKNVKKRK